MAVRFVPIEVMGTCERDYLVTQIVGYFQTLSRNRPTRGHGLFGRRPNQLFLSVIFAAAVMSLVIGCGYSGSATPVAINGVVMGGRQAVNGASIQIYAAGTNGIGSASTPLLEKPVLSDSNGKFSIPAEYGCPSASSEVYVVARGGSAGATGEKNSALALSSLLGPCSGLAALGSISVNEVTTVGSVWPLAQYFTSPTHLGSAANDTSFANAIGSVPEFINIAQGSSPGTPTSTSYFAESDKLYSLADALSACVDSSGGQATDHNPCDQLFSVASPSGLNAPTDTLAAAILIAQNPNSNVAGIFDLTSGSTPFQPMVTAAPTDWTLPLSYRVSTPSISLPTGIYRGTQEVSISDATEGTAIYYTSDGTLPNRSSNLFTGAFSVLTSATVQAIAMLHGSSSAVASSTLTITPVVGPAAKLVFLQQPTNALAGAAISPGVQVAVEDSNGNVETSAANPLTLALLQGTSLGGTLTVTPRNGIATFSNVTLASPGEYTLVASGPGAPSADSASFVVSQPAGVTTPSPVRLAFLQQPLNALAGADIAPAVEVVVEDTNGNVVTAASNSVTLSLSGGAALRGSLTMAAHNGIATFSDLSVSNVGTRYTLSATTPGLTSATSTTFNISATGNGSAPSPVGLLFLQQPSNALAGATISPAIEVEAVDGTGKVVSTVASPITIALNGGTGLGGTLTVSPLNGIATFSNLSVSAAGTGYTLSATSPNLTSATSNTFSISAGNGGAHSSPAKLAFRQQPSNALSGAVISPAIEVVVEDAQGNPDTDATSVVSLTLPNGSGLGGARTATAQNGIATFNNVTISIANTGLTLLAASSRLNSALSNPFAIIAPSVGVVPAPTRLAYLQQPSNVVAGSAISPAVRVAIEDASGNVLSTATNPVTLSIAGGGLAGTLTVAPQNGVATFSNLSVSAAGTYTISATSSGLTAASSSSFAASASSGSNPVAAVLAFQQQPSNAQTGAVIAPAVQVVVEDSSGHVVTTAANPVSLLVSDSTATFAGTLTATPQNGVATFSNLSIGTAGTYTLSATSNGLPSANSNGFTISPPSQPTATKLGFSSQPANALTGAAIVPAVQVALEDSSGNIVTGAKNPVTMALTGESSLAGTLTVTPQNGVAVFRNLSVSNGGIYTLTATSPGLSSATSANFTISVSTSGATYYLSPSGSDSNSGLSAGLSWLTPNHPVNCGDVIIAASGTYSNASFYTGRWGTVTCAAGNNVAWLKCAVFDTCKINATDGNQGMWVDKSYWGVQGWEVTTSASGIYSTCFIASPNSRSGVSIHHIIFANDIANGCSQSGLAGTNQGSLGVDYLAVIGSIAFNTAQGKNTCASGISVYQPVQSDSAPGTHIYVAGNFSYGNLEPVQCNGTTPTDGEGIIFDTFDGSQGHLPAPYTAQAVATNNIVVNNGGKGIEVSNNSAGSSNAPIYLINNTSWGNLTDPNQTWLGCGEVAIAFANDVQTYGNLISTKSPTGCGGNPIYAVSVASGSSSDSVYHNVAFGYGGNNTFMYASGGFAFASSNSLGVNPDFADPTIPGAPNCQSASNVTSCMAPVIAAFAPTTASSQEFGYQVPSSVSTSDPLFPQWLCNVNLPPGLVTSGCQAAH
jgi:Chitobiase/beta-hexosaminidase C-terminal domain